jgi:hypothetical protein
MSAKHTPGPWSARRNPWVRWEIHYAGGQLAVIAKPDDPASPPPVSETEANAHLIAAAPDLYDVVEALIAIREHPSYISGMAADENSPLIDAARAALAKARGTV